MNTKFFVGIDVSKPYFDASLMRVVDHQKGDIQTIRFENSLSGIKHFEKWLKSYQPRLTEDIFIVIENTGIYHRLLWSFCSKKNIPIHIGNGAHIKWSFGIARGKNDKIDSIRLCGYAQKHYEDLKSAPVLNPVLLSLKDMMTSRTKLLSQINGLKSYLKELSAVSEPSVRKVLEQAHKDALNGLAASIKMIEAQIKKIILENAEIKANHELLITVPGIGHLTAVYIICCTSNFAFKISGKQLACYAGVVPFEHSSGISVKGRNRVHKMANKELKKLLHLCSLSAIQRHQEFKDYYMRKKAEGKHSLSILNAIKNKIVLRAVAVVNNKRPYQQVA